MKTETYNKIREHIVRANPNLIEREFEFEATVNNSTEPTVIRTITLKSPIVFDSFLDQKMGKLHIDSNLFRKTKEIERPIRLADVLLAINLKPSHQCYVVTEAGTFWRDTGNGLFGIGRHSYFCKWNLLKDDLRDQSDECGEFLLALFEEK